MKHEGMITLLQSYIARCDEVIDSGDLCGAKAFVNELVSTLSSIDGIRTGLDSYSPGSFASYGGITVSSPEPDYINDVRKLKGKIEVEMAKETNDQSPQEESLKGRSSMPCKIFISHASKDKNYVVKLVEFLEDIGVGEKDLFCSSVDGYGIPMDENIYDYLQKQFQENNLHVIYVLSDNYYKSVACLNEMGAAWVLRQKYSTILLPGFKYERIDGAIDPRKIVLKLDETESSIDQHLGELMDGIVSEFNLTTPSRSKWDRIRKRFKNDIKEIIVQEATDSEGHDDKEKGEGERETHSVRLSSDAMVFLAYAGTDKNGTVMICRMLGGTSVSAGKWNFVGNGGAREEARWIAVVEELEGYGLLKAASNKREIFNLTYNGFKYSDKAREKIDTDKSPDEYLKDDEE